MKLNSRWCRSPRPPTGRKPSPTRGREDLTGQAGMVDKVSIHQGAPRGAMGPLSSHTSRLVIAGLLLWTSLACQTPAAPAAAPRAPDTTTAGAAPIPVRLSQPVAGLGYTSIYVA